MASDEDLLIEFTKWSFKHDRATDAVEDNNWGAIVRDENKKRGKNYWFLPGSWGQTRRNPRSFDVDAGTTLVCVVATSHATELELPDGKNNDEATLKALAKDIDALWRNPYIRITHPDGTVDEKFSSNLRPVTTNMYQVDVHRENGYSKVINNKHGNGINVVSIGRLFKFVPQSGGTTEIEIAGHAKADPKVGKFGEAQYDIAVEYKVTPKP
jgi:hypothetical protein